MKPLLGLVGVPGLDAGGVPGGVMPNRLPLYRCSELPCWAESSNAAPMAPGFDIVRPTEKYATL